MLLDSRKKVESIGFQFLERYRGRTNVVVLYVWEFLWACEWLEKASSIEGLFWRKRQERRREVLPAKERDRSGNFFRIAVKGKGGYGQSS